MCWRDDFVSTGNLQRVRQMRTTFFASSVSEDDVALGRWFSTDCLWTAQLIHSDWWKLEWRVPTDCPTPSRRFWFSNVAKSPRHARVLMKVRTSHAGMPTGHDPWLDHGSTNRLIRLDHRHHWSSDWRTRIIMSNAVVETVSLHL
jgi:hypothetical protein